MPIDKIILDPTDMTVTPILEEFLDRPRRLKYDHYHGKLYQIVWTPAAEKMRKERQLELRRQKYRDEHPEKPKNDVSLYLRKKMKRIENEYQAVTQTDIAGNLVDTLNAGAESGLRMMSSQTVAFDMSSHSV
jgi:hypothetical protein